MVVDLPAPRKGEYRIRVDLETQAVDGPYETKALVEILNDKHAPSQGLENRSDRLAAEPARRFTNQSRGLFLRWG